MINISAERFGELLDAEARLAAVLALCDKAPKFVYRNLPSGEGVLSVSKVRAAARGEGDRSAEPPSQITDPVVQRIVDKLYGGEGDRGAEEFPPALTSEGGQKLYGNSGGNDA